MRKWFFTIILLVACLPVTVGATSITAFPWTASPLLSMTQDTSLGMDSYIYTLDAPAGTPVDRAITVQELSDTIIADIIDSDLPSSITRDTELVGVDETYASGWDSDTGLPEKDDIYDYLHQIDTDDDGSLSDESWLSTWFTNLIGAAHDTAAELTALFATKLSIADLDGTPADDANTAPTSKYIYDNLSSFTNRYSEGETTTALSGTTPEVLSGGVYQTDSNGTITAFTKATGSFSANDWVVVQSDDVSVFDFTADGNIRRNGLSVLDFTGEAGVVFDLFFRYTGSFWLCNLPSGMTGPNAMDEEPSLEGATCPLYLPTVWADANHRLLLFTVSSKLWPHGVLIDYWKLTATKDPTTEFQGDLMYADNIIGVANSAVVDVLDSTSGVSSEDTDANINSGDPIPVSKDFYIQLDSDPIDTDVTWNLFIVFKDAGS